MARALSAREMLMKWPSMLADGDALIAREDTVDGPRFVVHSRLGPQLSCHTYLEAETCAVAFADSANAQAWYLDGVGVQLVLGDQKKARMGARR